MGKSVSNRSFGELRLEESKLLKQVEGAIVRFRAQTVVRSL
jgi:hypothetical protein